MPQPTPYNRSFSFTDYQTANPSDPLPGNQVDAQLNGVEQTLDQILANLELIQRDDGAVANDSIGVDQLKAEVSFGLNAVTDWAIGVAYTANNGVWYNNALYRCVSAHTSTVFATDLAASRWSLLVDLSLAVTSASAAAASAASAAASYDSFDDRYLGAKSSAPTLDNDGNALLTGALYWDTVGSVMNIYTGSAWQAAVGALATAPAGSITNTMLANMAANTVKCRAASSSGAPSDVALSASNLLGRGSSGDVAAISVGAGLLMSGTTLSVTSLALKHQSGRYYGAANFVKGISDGNIAVSANQLYLVPFYVPETQTYTRIGVAVSTLSAGNVRLGIYDSVAGLPVNLVLDAGTASTGSTGLKEVVISQNLPAGFYWLCAVFSATPTMSGVLAASCSAMMGVSGFGGVAYTYLYKAFTYGALPSTLSGLSVDNATVPWFGLQA